MPYDQIDNLKIHYQKTGKGEGLIFLHGILFNIGLYKDLIQILDKKYEVYAIDLPMHGKSSNPKKCMSIETFAATISDFVNKHKIKNPTICAHSAGALIALEYAAKKPVKELILLEPAGLDVQNSKINLWLKILIVKQLISLKYNMVKTAAIVKESIQTLLRNSCNRRFWEMFNSAVAKDYSKRIKKIKCPIKILLGKTSKMFAKGNLKKAMNGRCKIIFVNGNHDWPLLKAEEIKKYI